MVVYLSALLWLLSIPVCVFIGMKRGVTPTLFWRAIVIIFGPIAIPLLLLAKPNGVINDSSAQEGVGLSLSKRERTCRW